MIYINNNAENISKDSFPIKLIVINTIILLMIFVRFLFHNALIQREIHAIKKWILD